MNYKTPLKGLAALLLAGSVLSSLSSAALAETVKPGYWPIGGDSLNYQPIIGFTDITIDGSHRYCQYRVQTGPGVTNVVNPSNISIASGTSMADPNMVQVPGYPGLTTTGLLNYWGHSGLTAVFCPTPAATSPTTNTAPAVPNPALALSYDAPSGNVSTTVTAMWNVAHVFMYAVPLPSGAPVLIGTGLSTMARGEARPYNFNANSVGLAPGLYKIGVAANLNTHTPPTAPLELLGYPPSGMSRMTVFELEINVGVSTPTPPTAPNFSLSGIADVTLSWTNRDTYNQIKIFRQADPSRALATLPGDATSWTEINHPFGQTDTYYLTVTKTGVTGEYNSDPATLSNPPMPTAPEVSDVAGAASGSYCATIYLDSALYTGVNLLQKTEILLHDDAHGSDVMYPLPGTFDLPPPAPYQTFCYLAAAGPYHLSMRVIANNVAGNWSPAAVLVIPPPPTVPVPNIATEEVTGSAEYKVKFKLDSHQSGTFNSVRLWDNQGREVCNPLYPSACYPALSTLNAFTTTVKVSNVGKVVYHAIGYLDGFPSPSAVVDFGVSVKRPFGTFKRRGYDIDVKVTNNLPTDPSYIRKLVIVYTTVNTGGIPPQRSTTIVDVPAGEVLTSRTLRLPSNHSLAGNGGIVIYTQVYPTQSYHYPYMMESPKNSVKTFTGVMRGDVDANGKVELNDLFAYLNYQVGGAEPKCLETINGDRDRFTIVRDPRAPTGLYAPDYRWEFCGGSQYGEQYDDLFGADGFIDTIVQSFYGKQPPVESPAALGRKNNEPPKPGQPGYQSWNFCHVNYKHAPDADHPTYNQNGKYCEPSTYDTAWKNFILNGHY